MINHFKAALQEIWQDKRTLWSRLWLPFLMFCGVLLLASLSLQEMGGSGDSTNDSGDSNEAFVSPNSTIGIVANENADSLVAELKRIDGVDYQMIDNMDTLQTMMDNSDLDMAIVIDEFFDDALKTGNSGEILVYHNSFDDALKEGIKNGIEGYERQVLNDRMAASGFNESFTNPINISEIDASGFTKYNNTPSTESDGRMEENIKIPFNEIGGVFLLLLFYFAWLGGIFPALTLFTTDRLSQIVTNEAKPVLIARTLAVAVFGLLHALLFYLVAILLFKTFAPSGNFYMNMVKSALSADMMPIILVGLIPLTAVFSTFLSWSVTKRGTFKEGQNRIQPLKISIGLFLLMGITASFGTSLIAYLIPVFNIGTLSRILLQNDLNWLYLTLTYAVCFGIAYVCYLQALKEFEMRIQQPILVEDIIDIENTDISNTDDFISNVDND
ncbi:MAG: hypothetical protein ACI97N_000409 [Cognaticolwellia sp.]|jgi:hypothetical protein